jgi:hypothetical protein
MIAHPHLDSNQVSNLDRRWIHSLILAFSTSGESPPPATEGLFGRDELIDKIVGLVENLTPIALIGAGGIGKTSIALTVLHHDRIKNDSAAIVDSSVATNSPLRPHIFSADYPRSLVRVSRIRRISRLSVLSCRRGKCS